MCAVELSEESQTLIKLSHHISQTVKTGSLNTQCG